MFVSPPASPLAVRLYRLTRSDALAFESRPRELTGWPRTLLLLWIASAGAITALLPEAWTGGGSDWRVFVIGGGLALVQFALAMVFLTLRHHQRAAARLPVPVDVRLEEWSDHLAITENGKTRHIALETISAAGATARHAFVFVGPEVLIVPLSAFAHRPEMETFAAVLDEMAEGNGPQ